MVLFAALALTVAPYDMLSKKIMSKRPFLISENEFLILEIRVFGYKEITVIILYQKIDVLSLENHFLISKIRFLIPRIHFLISQNI